MAAPKHNEFERAQIRLWISPRITKRAADLVPLISAQFGISRCQAYKYWKQVKDGYLKKITKQIEEIKRDQVLVAYQIMMDDTAKPSERLKANRELGLLCGTHAPKQVAVSLNPLLSKDTIVNNWSQIAAELDEINTPSLDEAGPTPDQLPQPPA